ncbi:MAG: response regulator transcription factor, partial [Dehalococcoidia bacterium]
ARPAAAATARRMRALGLRNVPRGAHGTTRANPAGLTRREVEVLRLLATGASNQEIADMLVVSVRTAERHLLHIYGKIGARRRGDAVAYALRGGLA